MSLSRFKILSFDCYGTLIDWETGLLDALSPLIGRLTVNQIEPDEILEAFGRHEARQEEQTPHLEYARLLAIVYKRMAEEWGVPAAWEECARFGRTVPEWQPFPDSVDALAYLKKHFKLAILSNVDNVTFAGTAVLLRTQFDYIFTAEDIGSYKPDLRNFNYMLGQLTQHGISKAEVLHVAESLHHDHRPANALGLASCWIHRRHAKKGFGATRPPDAMPEVEYRFESLADLVSAHRIEEDL